MINGCWDCTFKHLAAASIAADELALGYETRGRMTLVGNLVHAEAECVNLHRGFAMLIREHRLRVMPSFEKQYEIPFEALCEFASVVAIKNQHPAVPDGGGYEIPAECFVGLDKDITTNWPDNATGDART